MSLAYIHRAILEQQLGDDAAAISHLLEAYRLAPMAEQNFAAADAAGKLALVYAMAGDPRVASHWLDIEENAPMIDSPFGRTVRTPGMVARALIGIAEADADSAADALDYIEHALITDRDYWPFVLHARTLYALAWGDRRGMLDELEHRRDAQPHPPGQGGVFAPLLAAAEANLQMALGRGAQAWSVLIQASMHPRLQVARARLAVLTGDPSGALEIAVPLLDGPATAVRAGQPVDITVRLNLTLIVAVALLRLGRHDEALPALQTAIDLSGRELVFAFGCVPRRDLLELIDLLPVPSSLFTGDLLEQIPDVFPTGVSLLELTRQERLVLAGMAAGMKVDEMAAAYTLSRGTIKTHQSHIYRKLGVNSRAHALAAAAELGLLNLPDEV